MEKIYTCICGGQTWKISEEKVTCDKCGKAFVFRPMRFCERNETPDEFNERIQGPYPQNPDA